MFIHRFNLFINRANTRLAAIACLIVLGALTGCQSQSPADAMIWVAWGEYGKARQVVREQLVNDHSDRMYLLDRMRLGILTLDDGYPRSAQTVFTQIYETLRTQGINKDKTVASVVLNEDLKIWKGEPFEQALALFYYSVLQAMQGSWDNARAAADNSLFYLRDFGADETGKRIDTLAIAKRAIEYERSLAQGTSPQDAPREHESDNDDYLNTGYVVRESNFTLGYLMNGLANLQLGRIDEARDHLHAAVITAPWVQPVCDRLLSGQYNTVFVVAYGLGPEKIGYGPDAALAGFNALHPSDDAPLAVRINDQPTEAFPVVCDVNAMAQDHMWNNLEDVRLAKSHLGTAALWAGTFLTDAGAHRGDEAMLGAGLGVMAAGLFLKAGAHVDTRYCDVMPQRFYLVPVNLDESTSLVELQVQGRPGSRMVLAGLASPRTSRSNLYYVRLNSDWGDHDPPPWAVSGQIYYSNDSTGPIPGVQRPYILGGQGVRLPSDAAMRSYLDVDGVAGSAGLTGMTLNDLIRLYRDEGIKLDESDENGMAGLHILEGGRSLVGPRVGSAGFMRLFGQVHPPYQPRSEKLKAMTSGQVQD